VRGTRPLSGGCVGEVYAVDLEPGAAAQRGLPDRIVAKVDQSAKPVLDREGFMLDYLREHGLPCPHVYHRTPSLLIMEFMDGSSRFDASAQRDAAEKLAALHAKAAPKCGLDRDTLIGGLHQPNPWTDSWVDFFREHRLLYMAEQARNAGSLPTTVHRRIETFAEQLGEFIGEPEQPALLHGDVWTTNVLAAGGRITGFLDPACYYGHPEIELAFINLFHTFGETFYSHYADIAGIEPGFFDTRCALYNLYPLLVHTRLFGIGYVSGVDSTLRGLGF